MRRWLSSLVVLEAIGLIVGSYPTPAQQRTPPETVRAMEATIHREQAKQRQARLQTLAAQLSDEDLRKRNAALSQILEMRLPPEEGIPLFLENLRNSSPEVQQGVIRALGAYGPTARQAIPSMIRILGEPDTAGFVRAEIALSLVKIDPSSPEVGPGLIRALQDPDAVFSVRLACVRALGQLGSVSKEARAALTASLKDPMTAVQCEAYGVLGRIESGAASPSLIDSRRLDQLPPGKSSQSFLAVERQGTRARAMIPSLVQIVEQQQEENYLRCAAIQTLGRVGPGQPVATEVLLRTLGGEDEYLSSLAIRALEKIGPEDTVAVGPLAASLADVNPKIRLQAALALARVGAGASEAVPALNSAIERSTGSTNFEEVDSYLDALSGIGHKASSSGPFIAAALAPDSVLLRGREGFLRSYLRTHLFVTLARVGVPLEAHGLVLQGLQSNDRYEFAGAAVAAGSLGAQGADAVPYLMRALDPEFEDMYIMFTFLMHTTASLEAIRALGKIGAPALAAVPLLEQIARTSWSSFPFDTEAREALQAIRGQSPHIRPLSKKDHPH